MNVKFGLIAGAAIACAVMTGCKAPKAQTPGGSAVEPTRPAGHTVVKTVDEKPEQQPAKPAPQVKAQEENHCKCAPGAVHDAPCTCGAPDCKCKVREPAPEPEYTIYRVKSGDMLSAICKRYGLRQRKVLELNPGLNPNKLIAGRKIKLPGKIDVSAEEPVVSKPAAKPAAKPASKPAAKSAAPAAEASAKVSSYSGPTKDYVVKNGDFLGKIARDNGITVKCLKDMNGLKNNNIRVGQKLKVPAEKPVAEAKAADVAKVAKAPEAPAAPKEGGEAAAAEAAPAPAEPAAATPDEKPAEAAPAVEQVKSTAAELDATAAAPRTHVVKENEDIVSIAIMYDISPSALMDLNDLKSGEALTPGRVRKLPPNAKIQ